MSPEVEVESRETDRKIHPMAIARTRKTIGGIIIVLAGCLFAFIREDPWIGFGVALVGAGIVDSSAIIPTRRKED